jgi:mannose-6-phosphate isomerase-like protein (cupin superfamily)
MTTDAAGRGTAGADDGSGMRPILYATEAVMNVVNLAQMFGRFIDAWSPKIVGEVNDMHVKVVKLRGEFVWHHHEVEDELFLVVAGRLRMRLRDGDREVGPGELIIVPRGVEHCPVALTDEVHVVLLEPKGTLNTGNVSSERTVADLERL